MNNPLPRTDWVDVALRVAIALVVAMIIALIAESGYDATNAATHPIPEGPCR